MKNTKVCILAKSYKRFADGQRGFCVAGVDDKGNWIRLVSNNEGESLEPLKCNFSVLDVINANVLPTPLPFQPENAILLDFKKESQTTLQKIIDNFNLLSSEEHVYIDTEPYLSEDEMKCLEHSLLIAKVQDLVIKQNKITNKLKAEFTYNGTKYENISITDPNYMRDFGCRDAYIVVSVPATPWVNNLYYKFIAAVYPIRH